MSGNKEIFHDGFISLGCTIPAGLSASDIGFTLFEINNAVSTIAEPPVARVESLILEFDEGNDDIDDYRNFDVNFESQATAEQIQQAVQIVTDAFRRVIESR